MRLDINLATQPYEDARKFWLRWGGALFVLGLTTLILFYLTIMGWSTARQYRGLISQAQNQIGARDRERQKAEMVLNQPQNRNTRDRSQFLNDLFERKAFSWTRVFEELEKVMPARLHVVSIHPDTSADNQLVIKLVVAGESRDRALELVRKMEESQRFHQTHIEEERTEETSARNTASGDLVQFNISAEYVPETPVVAAVPQGAP